MWPQEELESVIAFMVTQARGGDAKEEQVQTAINRAWDAQDQIEQ